MAILQFAFGGDAHANDFLPHNYPSEHASSTPARTTTTPSSAGGRPGSATRRARRRRSTKRARARARLRAAATAARIHWDFIRALFVSVADTAIVPLQDVLGAGAASARMNLPGRPGGNWRWRFATADLTPEMRRRLRGLTEGSGRTLPPA